MDVIQTELAGLLTPRNIELASMRASLRVHYYTHAKAAKMEQDPYKAHRLTINECVPCYYTGSVYTEEAVTANCQNCGNLFAHHHTRVPAYCEGCAKTHRVCRHCGARLEQKPAGAGP